MLPSKRQIHSILKRSSAKNARDKIFAFRDYLHTIGTPSDGGSVVFNNIFGLIFLTHSFLCLNPSLFPSTNALTPISQLCLILSDYFPIVSDTSIQLIIIISYCSLIAGFYIAYICSLLYFNEHARLSKWQADFFVLFIDFAFPSLSINVSAMFAFSLYQCIYGSQLALAIVAAVLSLAINIISNADQCFNVAPQIILRPTSLSIFCSHRILYILVCLDISVFLSAFGSLLNSKAGAILCMVTVIPKIILLLVSVRRYTWAIELDRLKLTSMTCASIFLAIFLPIRQLRGETCDELSLVIGLIVYLVIFFALNYSIKRKTIQLSKQLKSIEANEVSLASFSKSDAFNILYEGFRTGFRQCHDFSLFDKAFELYPNEKDLIKMHARFAAIYPNEKEQMMLAQSRLISLKKGDYEIKYLLFQLQSIMKKRETTMSKEVTKSIQKAEEKADRAKTQIRYIWEKVLRGQTEDMEDMNRTLLHFEEDVDADFKQICLINANNPNAFLAYSKYLKDIECQFGESKEIYNIYLSMKGGSHARGEVAYYYASRQIPSLPDEVTHIGMRPLLMKSEASDIATLSVSKAKMEVPEFITPEVADDGALQIESMVDSVKSPTLFLMIIGYIFGFCILYMIVSIFAILDFQSKVNEFTKENYLLKSIATVKEELTLMVVLMHRYAMGKLGLLDTLDPNQLKSSIELVSTAESEMTSASADIPESSLKTYFESIFVRSITTDNNGTTENISVQSAVSQFVAAALSVLSSNSSQIYNLSQFWFAVDNAEAVSNSVATTLSSLYSDFSSLRSTSDINWAIEVYVGIGVSFIICSAEVLYVQFRVEKSKKNLYSSFKSIPGSAIAAILQKLATSEEEEKVRHSKLEENAIYILRSTSKAKSSHVIVIYYACLGVAIIIAWLIAFCLYYCPETVSTLIQPRTAHYSAVIAAQETIALCILRLQRTESLPSRENLTELKEKNMDAISGIADMLDMLRIGTSGGTIGGQYSSYKTFGTLMSSSSSSSLSYENSLSNISVIISKCSNDGTTMPTEVLGWAVNTSHENFVVPAISIIYNNVISYDSKNLIIVFCVVPFAIFVNLVIAIVVILYLKRSDTVMLNSLRLLLLCNPDVVLRSRNMMKILANDFSESKCEDVNSIGAHEKVVSHLTDAVLFMTSDLIIQSANSAVENVLGVSLESMKGKSLFDAIKEDPQHPTSVRAIKQAIEAVKGGLRPPNLKMEVEIQRGGKSSTLQFSMIALSLTSEVLTKPTNVEAVAIFCCTFTDLTSTVASRELLNSERERGAHLLSTILPPMIVKKLQRGEKNVSFSVASASVVFIDIVSFTPWCGSLPASIVMSTLNHLFGMYDKLLLKYDKMTKIKCIGDCYMAAGGLFDEVNQPLVHAKQAVSFCLDVIAGLDEFNRKHNTQLRVRAGCNTGGPIVAGVLGIDKPNFDILGPSISMAEAMEHYGVPMFVHIPQHVYELIYSEGFRIKEKGETQVKGGNKVKTYLVSGYASL